MRILGYLKTFKTLEDSLENKHTLFNEKSEHFKFIFKSLVENCSSKINKEYVEAEIAKCGGKRSCTMDFTDP